MTAIAMTAMNIEPAHIKDPVSALRFMLAGDAYCTFRSEKTDAHLTYHIEVNKKPSTVSGPSHFVQVLTGPDKYEYLGCIYKRTVYRHGSRSRINSQSRSALAFPWVWERLQAGRVPETCDIFHEGRCGRCGRRLTHPESIETGMGPECIKKVEGT